MADLLEELQLSGAFEDFLLRGAKAGFRNLLQYQTTLGCTFQQEFFGVRMSLDLVRLPVAAECPLPTAPDPVGMKIANGSRNGLT